MASTARLSIDPAFVVAPVRRELFGSFVEHMGRCVYTGIYEPDHPSADEAGFRGDVAELTRELGVSVVRYPGGNFVSNYVWENGVGPKDERPTTLDLAWRSVETNQVGTDDFLQWCERLGLQPMITVNLGTRGLVEAVELLQYCNAEPGTQLADRRVKNGRLEPYDVRLWCLGNEMDGPWQIGHKTAEEYARLAEETGKVLKRFDAGLQLVACGSSHSRMPTFGTWERSVLERCFDVVDYISAHAYYEPVDDDLDSFLACADDMDRFIGAVVATADHVAAVRRSDKQIMISFDEWNVWFETRFKGENDLTHSGCPAVDRGCVRRTRRRGGRQLVDHLAPARRPGRCGLSGPVGQRDRPDHDRARWPGLAADDLPPFRPDLQVRTRHRAANAEVHTDDQHGAVRRGRSGDCRGHARPGQR